ncbi:MAG: hypothetical protein IIB12_05540, partial [Chloroflexi bacterium]|nr:hypothetical protein [Chloroflexota bacterium]
RRPGGRGRRLHGAIRFALAMAEARLRLCRARRRSGRLLDARHRIVQQADHLPTDHVEEPYLEVGHCLLHLIRDGVELRGEAGRPPAAG